MSKEQCVNKKLHPYYKTGIYGWIGEEVDDNDYIICPICGEVLGMNYWDYSAENSGDNKCPKCKQELDYSEIYYFEDTLYFRQVLESKESRLADLETKLAESEKKHLLDEIEWQNYCSFKHIEPQIKGCLDREREYEKKLAEKEKEISNLKGLINERDKQIKNLKTNKKRVVEHKNNVKISFALEQLEKVKEFADIDFRKNCYINAVELDKFIDNQIKAIKGEK